MSGHPEQPLQALIVVADIGDRDKPETCNFQLFFSRWGGVSPETNEERIALFKEFGQHFCEPFRSAAAWLREDDTYIPRDRLTHWPNPQKWDNHGGRITLAGDAAHPMAPSKNPQPQNLAWLHYPEKPTYIYIYIYMYIFNKRNNDQIFALDRGQGLNNALEDAAHYVEAIASFLGGKQSMSDAITDYDDEVLTRGKKEIEISYNQAVAFHHWNLITESPMAKYGTYKIQESNL